MPEACLLLNSLFVCSGYLEFWVKLLACLAPVPEMNHYTIEVDFCNLKPLKHPHRIENYWHQYGIGNRKLQHGVTNGTTYPKTHGSCGLVGKYSQHCTRKACFKKHDHQILWWGLSKRKRSYGGARIQNIHDKIIRYAEPFHDQHFFRKELNVFTIWSVTCAESWKWMSQQLASKQNKKTQFHINMA